MVTAMSFKSRMAMIQNVADLYLTNPCLYGYRLLPHKQPNILLAPDEYAG